MPLNIRDTQAYIAYSKNPALSLRDVPVYAAVVAPRQINVRQIYGYALARTPTIPNFGQAANLSMLAALNRQFNTAFTAAQVTFTNPQPLSNDDLGYNSTVTLNVMRSAGYVGPKTMRYNRWSFSQAFLGKDISALPNGMGTTLVASLGVINTKFGLALVAADIVDGAVASGATKVTLTAASTSLYYKPGTTVTLGT